MSRRRRARPRRRRAPPRAPPPAHGALRACRRTRSGRPHRRCRARSSRRGVPRRAPRRRSRPRGARASPVVGEHPDLVLAAGPRRAPRDLLEQWASLGVGNARRAADVARRVGKPAQDHEDDVLRPPAALHEPDAEQARERGILDHAAPVRQTGTPEDALAERVFGGAGLAHRRCVIESPALAGLLGVGSWSAAGGRSASSSWSCAGFPTLRATSALRRAFPRRGSPTERGGGAGRAVGQHIGRDPDAHRPPGSGAQRGAAFFPARVEGRLPAAASSTSTARTPRSSRSARSRSTVGGG